MKKKKDPIFSVCFVVFVVACVGVLGVYVDEHYIATDDRQISVGDDVTINYTGSYYNYYGEPGAVVFDTTYSGIGNDAGVTKANEYSKTSYKPLDVTVGDGDLLKMFENSLIGHKVGDKFRIEIPADQAYLAPSSETYNGVSMTDKVPKVQTMTKAQFEDIYGSDYKLSSGSMITITSAYGWPANVYLDATSNKVVITNMPEVTSADSPYEYIGNEDSEFGKVTYAVTSVSGDSISVTMNITGTVSVGDDGRSIQMLKVNVDGTPIYVTGVGNGTYDYKVCEERCNENLYFEIEIVSID